MIRRRHWIVATVMAMVLHALVFSVFAQGPAQGADLPSQQGIEVELGMLGDLGGTAEVSAEENQPPTTEAPPAEPESESILEPVIEHEPEPEPLQKAEVQVMSEPMPAPKPKPKPKPIPTPKPEPKPAAKAVSTIASNKPDDVNAGPAQANAVVGETSRPGGTRSGDNSAAAAAAGARKSWYAQVAAHLARHKHYPMRARRMRHEAIVTLSFVVARDGSIRQSEITGPSQYQALNRAVEEMLARAKPLPVFPENLPGDEISLSIPVAFKLQ